MLAREEDWSPMLLPDSKVLRNQVSCTDARAAAQSRPSLFTLPLACSLTASVFSA